MKSNLKSSMVMLIAHASLSLQPSHGCLFHSFYITMSSLPQYESRNSKAPDCDKLPSQTTHSICGIDMCLWQRHTDCHSV